ncbi:MAG: hypothetical protein FWD62_00715 [Betaproteobacteria bacterium]|nr:hypothetical protein [Betaproteobacteria bacterium]
MSKQNESVNPGDKEFLESFKDAPETGDLDHDGDGDDDDGNEADSKIAKEAISAGLGFVSGLTQREDVKAFAEKAKEKSGSFWKTRNKFQKASLGIGGVFLILFVPNIVGSLFSVPNIKVSYRNNPISGYQLVIYSNEDKPLIVKSVVVNGGDKRCPVNEFFPGDLPMTIQPGTEKTAFVSGSCNIKSAEIQTSAGSYSASWKK